MVIIIAALTQFTQDSHTMAILLLLEKHKQFFKYAGTCNTTSVGGEKKIMTHDGEKMETKNTKGDG